MKKIITGVFIFLAVISLSGLGCDVIGPENQDMVYPINIFLLACVLAFSALATLVHRGGNK